MTAMLTAYECRLLATLNESPEDWHMGLILPLPPGGDHELAVALREQDRKRALDGLKRKGYVDATGRGKFRAYGIADKGKAALDG